VIRSAPDEGSAIVEFVLVLVLVLVLTLAVVQLALALYVRNTLVAAAAEGARFAAAQNQQPTDGAAYTQTLIRQTLPASYADNVTARYTQVGGVPTVEVDVEASLPVFGWLGPSGTLIARGHAFEEQP
jgi:Flp pilus assembly protein TadG